jgi:hypothetical protein
MFKGEQELKQEWQGPSMRVVPFNVVQSPYWQDMVRATNTTPQGFKRPNYKKIQTNLPKKVEDGLAPIHAFME